VVLEPLENAIFVEPVVATSVVVVVLLLLLLLLFQPGHSVTDRVGFQTNAAAVLLGAAPQAPEAPHRLDQRGEGRKCVATSVGGGLCWFLIVVVTVIVIVIAVTIRIVSTPSFQIVLLASSYTLVLLLLVSFAFAVADRYLDRWRWYGWCCLYDFKLEAIPDQISATICGFFGICGTTTTITTTTASTIARIGCSREFDATTAIGIPPTVIPAANQYPNHKEKKEDDRIGVEIVEL